MKSLLPMLHAGLHACEHTFFTKGSGCIGFQASLQAGRHVGENSATLDDSPDAHCEHSKHERGLDL